MMRVLAIDPGVSHSAFVSLARPSSSTWVVLGGHRPNEISDLTLALAKFVASLHTSWETAFDLVCVESVAWSAFAGKGQGNGSASILECVGIARMIAAISQCPLEIVAPNSWRKHITGNGRATKKQAHAALEKLFCQNLTSMLSADELDAIAIGITGYSQWLKKNT